MGSLLHLAGHEYDASATGRSRTAPMLRRVIGATLGALLVYAARCGYQRPELLLDVANFRLC